MRITRTMVQDTGHLEDEVVDLFPEEGLSPLQVLDLPLRATDRIDIIVPVLPPSDLRLLACAWTRRYMERERTAGEEIDPRSWHAVDMSERFAKGDASEAELDEATACVRAVAKGIAWCANTAAWAAAQNPPIAARCLGRIAWPGEEARQVEDLRAVLSRLGA